MKPKKDMDGCETLVSLFLQRVAASGERTALLVKGEGGYAEISWNRLAREVRSVAAVLLALGVEPGDRVVQFSENRYEWLVNDLAILAVAAVHVPLHVSLTGPQAMAQIGDCGARVVLFSGAEQAKKLAACDRVVQGADSLPLVYLSVDPCMTDRGGRLKIEGCPIRTIGEWVDELADTTVDGTVDGLSDAVDWGAVGERMERLASDSLATILYTSGTTGEPKGVMLSHGNLVANTGAKIAAHGLDASDLRLGWLPLSHVFARTCDFYVTIATGSRLALAGSRETILDDCLAVRPTYINGVPYLFDKCYRLLRQRGEIETPGSLRALLGGAIRTCLCGGASLPSHVYDFFWKQDVPILEGYGLTETAPVISDCTLVANQPGSVGRPIPGVEVRIAPDGEILTRGPSVMQGYWQHPKATAATIRDGWLHTGDIGSISSRFYSKTHSCNK